MSKARAKGTKLETDVVNYLKQNGWPSAERHAQHGHKDVGDINIGPGVVIECKAEARFDLAGWIAELEHEMFNADTDDGVVVVKRRGSADPGEFYALMTFGMWCKLAKEAGL